jgi:hypothetical protein
VIVAQDVALVKRGGEKLTTIDFIAGGCLVLSEGDKDVLA